MDRQTRTLRSNSTPTVKDIRVSHSPASENKKAKTSPPSLDEIIKVIWEENVEFTRLLRKEIEDIHTEIRSVVDRLKNFETCLSEVSDTQRRHECEIGRLSEAVREKTTNTDLSQAVAEIEDRIARQTSAIIRGLPESPTGTVTEHGENDKSVFRDICGILNIKEMPEVELKRIGTIKADRHRLLKVTFRTKYIRDTVLERSKILRNSKYKEVFINKDLTVIEQRERQVLLNELRRRRENNEDVIIKRGKVVLRNESHLPQNFLRGF